MDEIPEVPKPSVIIDICRKVTQLRNELAAVIDQLPMSGLCKENDQVKVALKAMDDAVAKLQDCGKMCHYPVPLPKQEPLSTTSLSLFERAAMFQSWDRKRKNPEHHRPSSQQQKAAKSQP